MDSRVSEKGEREREVEWDGRGGEYGGGKGRQQWSQLMADIP